MHLDDFAQGSSYVHSIDPRIKIIAYVPLVFVVALLHRIIGCCIALGLALCFIAIGRISLRLLMNRLWVVNLFVVLLWCTLPFSTPGDPLMTAAGLTVSSQGLRQAVLITLKANAIFLFTVSLLGTTSIVSLTHALAHFRFPRKLVCMFFFFYRYIFDIHQEFIRLTRAAAARSFAPKTNAHTLKTYAFLVGMLFVKSYERSQRVYHALVLRGFKGYFPMVTHFHYHGRDFAFGVFMGGFIVLLLTLWK